MKNVQIPYDLFLALLQYHLMMDDDYEDEIRHGLEQKLEAMVRHELYAKYKTALTPEEREEARQRYLDERGIPLTQTPAHLPSPLKIRRLEADSLREMDAVSLRRWSVNVL